MYRDNSCERKQAVFESAKSFRIGAVGFSFAVFFFFGSFPGLGERPGPSLTEGDRLAFWSGTDDVLLHDMVVDDFVFTIFWCLEFYCVSGAFHALYDYFHLN